MKKKTFAVVGLGVFGEAVALEMENLGAEVIAIDKNQEKVNQIADYVTVATAIDVRDEGKLRDIGISNVDGMVVAIAGDTDASVMATIVAKDEGVPYVFAKALDDMHCKILKRVGADEVQIPERLSGVRIARNMVNDNIKDFVELSSKFHMVELKPKREWIGKSLEQLNLRRKLQINVVAIRRDGELYINIDPTAPIKEEDTLMIIASNNK